MVNIVQINGDTDGVLRKKAEEIKLSDIGSKKMNSVIDEMILALSKQDDGVAIAAPQIGYSLRIFVVSGKVLRNADDKYTSSIEEDYLIFINPSIVKVSREKQEVEEGCLSVRWKYGKVKRSEKVTIKAINEKGQKIERGASGLLAQVFQHEIDHLNGILFIDTAYDIEDMPQEKISNNQD